MTKSTDAISSHAAWFAKWLKEHPGAILIADVPGPSGIHLAITSFDPTTSRGTFTLKLVTD